MTARHRSAVSTTFDRTSSDEASERLGLKPEVPDAIRTDVFSVPEPAP